MSGVMVAAALNLFLVLLIPRPSLAWQQFAGVGVTAAAFPPQTLEVFKRLAVSPPKHPFDIYVLSMDDNDAILASLIAQDSLLHPKSQRALLHRPVDWMRPTTVRISELAAADMLLINPLQAQLAPAGQKVNYFWEERGVFTAWADKLDVSDGVSIFFSSPSAKILRITDSAKFREHLARLVARYAWDSTFAAANDLSRP
jgi:hypothetical protein